LCNLSLINTIELKCFDGDMGSLVALEGLRNIPFEIKRIYFIFNVDKNTMRGFHAHRNLRQIAICVSGSCRFALDNGKQREEVFLDRPTLGLMITGMTWREMYDFSSNCVLLVLASEYYAEDDYLRSYLEFKEKVRNEAHSGK